jgi:hypothetical protein
MKLSEAAQYQTRSQLNGLGDAGCNDFLNPEKSCRAVTMKCARFERKIQRQGEVRCFTHSQAVVARSPPVTVVVVVVIYP